MCKWTFLVAFYPHWSVFLAISLQTFLFSKTSGSIWSKLYTKPPWLGWIQVYTNDATGLFLTGDNSETVKPHWRFLKNFFFRTTGANLTKSVIKYFCVEGIQVLEMKGHASLKIIFLLQNHSTKINKLCLLIKYL